MRLAYPTPSPTRPILPRVAVDKPEYVAGQRYGALTGAHCRQVTLSVIGAIGLLRTIVRICRRRVCRRPSRRQ